MSGVRVAGLGASVREAASALAEAVLVATTLSDMVDGLAGGFESVERKTLDSFAWLMSRAMVDVARQSEAVEQLLNRRVLPLLDDFERAQAGTLQGPQRG